MTDQNLAICGVPNCVEKHHAKGYCQNHYARNKRFGVPDGKGKNFSKPQVCTLEGCENTHRMSFGFEMSNLIKNSAKPGDSTE